MKKNTMTKNEAIILVNVIFFLFNCTFILSVLFFSAMLNANYYMLHSVIVSLTVGVSLPTALLVIFIRLYSLVAIAPKVKNLFTKYSLPLIGLEKCSLEIVRLQDKFFTFLTQASIVMVVFYILSILPLSKSIEFVYIIIRLMLLCSIILMVGVMALDGLYIYFRCLFELIFKFYKEKNIDALLKTKFDNILTLFKKVYANVTYKPKRLKKHPYVSNLIFLLTPSIAGKRAFYTDRKF